MKEDINNNNNRKIDNNNMIDYNEISTFGGKWSMCGLHYLKNDLILIESDDLKHKTYRHGHSFAIGV
jgi:hypothetical protein